jgi:hypothetical protein
MEMGWGDVDWIHLVQDRSWWWTLVNTVMFQKRQGISGLAM